MKNSKRLLAMAVSAAIAAPMSAFATNGMNLEGYGPIATGMGGASMAYDNGTAAMMNNPATLGLMDDGSRLDLAVGVLGPDISAGMPGATWDSKSDNFVMPAAGYVTKRDKLTWGVGGFAQGGMGTEYNNQVQLGGGAFAHSPGGAGILGEGVLTGSNADPSQDNVLASVMGLKEFSEVGVMRILVPVAYDVNEKLTVGGSIDYVRATMDIQMALPGSALGAMAAKAPTAPGTLDGTLLNAFAMFDAGVAGGYFDFADGNPYSGETTGDGFAAKIGFTYKVNPQLSVGGTYHSETSLGDLSGNADLTLFGEVQTGPTTTGDAAATVDGKIKIKDFQWPQTIGFGLSYQMNDKLMIAADVKHIKWSEVMKDFKMSFVASDSANNVALGANGATLDAVLFQEWDDQTAFQLGASYQVNPAFVVRGGVNLSNNPVPDNFLSHLFPAIIKDHYTAGFGYAFTEADDVNFSLTYAPEVEATAGSGLTVTHSQLNYQLMYSHSF